MIEYKIDVLGKLREAGYTTYRIRRDGVLPSSAVKALADGKPVSFATLDALCDLLGCDVGDIIHKVNSAREDDGPWDIGNGMRDLMEKYKKQED